jgi:hypothetical protein
MGSEVVAVDMSRDSILRNRVRMRAEPLLGATRPRRLDALAARLSAIWQRGALRCLRAYPVALHAATVPRTCATCAAAGACFAAFSLSLRRNTKLFGKEGEHDGGIPFTRFLEGELREELEPYFTY